MREDGDHRCVGWIGIIHRASHGHRQRLRGESVVVVVERSLAGESYTRATRIRVKICRTTPIRIGAQLVSYTSAVQEVEDAIAAAYNGFATAREVVGKTDAGRPIFLVCIHQAAGIAIDPGTQECGGSYVEIRPAIVQLIRIRVQVIAQTQVQGETS